MASPLPPGDCEHCEGRGWILVEGAGAGAARPCTCRNAIQRAALTHSTGIPDRYSTCSLDNFDLPKDAVGYGQLLRGLSRSRRYVEDFLLADGGYRETGLLFVGPPGVGKTHLAVAVLRELLDRFSLRARFVDFTRLIHEIQATFNSQAELSQSRLLAPVIEAELLVLDELGAQKPTAWVQDLLYLVLNTRYTRRLPTLITTNYRLDAPRPSASLDRGEDPDSADDGRSFGMLSQRIPPALLSRLFEMTEPILLDGVADFRQQSGLFPRRLQA